MRTCKTCHNFFPVSEDEYDYEPGKGDCVTEKKDEKGKYWLSRPVMEGSAACSLYKIKLHKEFVA